jgi:DNA polymerase-3 subunit alpha (Gram-positive type)
MNDERLLKLFDQFQFTPLERSFFDGANLTFVRLHREEKRLELEIKVQRSLPFALYLDFKQRIADQTHTHVDLILHAQSCDLMMKDIQAYIKHVLKRSNTLLDESLFILENNTIYFLVSQLEDRMSETLDELSIALARLGIPYRCEPKLNTAEEVIVEEVERPRDEPKASLPLKSKRVLKKQAQLSSIQSLELGQKGVLVRGRIFQIDQQAIRNQSTLRQTYYIHDESDAIAFTVFLDDALKKEQYAPFVEGASVEVFGDVVYDNYSKDVQLLVREVNLTADWLARQDDASEKRVELHLHTKMSEMDAVGSIEAYLDQALAFGHRALAITDHNSVQAFPKAQRHIEAYLKKNPQKEFKVIYGVEMYMVDDALRSVERPQAQSLHDATYIVFDLETTGLSVIDDDIIEISALRLKDGLVQQRFQTFVHTEQQLSSFILEKTHIQQNDVRTAPSLKDALERFLEFVQTDILVAHNARFDLGFLQEKLRFLGWNRLENTVIDTLDLSKAVLSDRRSFRLGALAKYYKIPYDEAIAHRADYDTEVLSQVFMKLLQEPEVATLKYVDALNELNPKAALSKNLKYHINLLAKNQAGLKDLFKLVSRAHTERLVSFASSQKAEGEGSAEARILRSDVLELREHLLVGSSCYNSEVFDAAHTGSLAELEASMEFYDYIEIQAPENYQPLLDSFAIANVERLHTILKRIIDTAQRLRKPIVASGDVHYNHPLENIFRDIYIQAKSVGAQRHPLYLYNAQKRAEQESPRQYFRSTTDMLNQFAFLDPKLAYQIVVLNTQAIANQIEPIQPIQHQLFTPTIEGADQKLSDIVESEAERRYGAPLHPRIRSRIDQELKSIISHGFGVIYYTAHLLVQRSLKEGYMVGSRGSVGSSLVAHLMDITEVNPLAPHAVCPACHHLEFMDSASVESGYDLAAQACPTCQTNMIVDGQDIPFETFLGFEGDKVPDIDLNFSGDYQERAHAHTKEIFGEDKVFRAGTISTVAQRTAFGYVKGYFEEKNITRPNKQAYITYLAKGAEGVKRTSGQHPGGIIVIPQTHEVYDFTPVQYPANKSNAEWLTTHFEFADIHDNLLKLDLLGHVDPTAMRFLEQLSGVDVKGIPLNDPKVMSIFANTDALNLVDQTYREKTGAVGLPEFGTAFVRQILEMVHPSSFSELVKVSGLSHGTDVWLNNARSLLEQGHPFSDVIGCRDDIMLYLIQKKLPTKQAFDIMESVRKGRGLKDEWIELMQANQVPQWYIQSCLRIKYMFPKAHAVAYVIMAVRVAWFKVYQPLAYYASYFSLRATAHEYEMYQASSSVVQQRLKDIQRRLSDAQLKADVSHKEEELVSSLEVLLEMLARGYRFSALDLKRSHATHFLPDPDHPKQLIPPFIVLDGLGESVARSIVEARLERPFMSKQDLLSRTQINQSLVRKMEQLKLLDELDDANQMSLF